MQGISTDVLGELLRRQPASPARTAFAWQMVVGSRLARVTSVELRGTVLEVRAADGRWLTEIERAASALLPRLQQLLGKQEITYIKTR